MALSIIWRRKSLLSAGDLVDIGDGVDAPGVERCILEDSPTGDEGLGDNWQAGIELREVSRDIVAILCGLFWFLHEFMMRIIVVGSEDDKKR